MAAARTGCALAPFPPSLTQSLRPSISPWPFLAPARNRTVTSRKVMEFRAVKGMPDILPEEVRRFALLEAAFRRVVELHGFSEVRTPLLESTSLFARSTGETSEIVEKQMFSLTKGRESFTLRPEGTPGVARAFLNHTLYAKEPVTRWYYIGAMFRAENTQRGRQRQFHQAGCEVYGDGGPIVDAEIIDMLVGFLR